MDLDNYFKTAHLAFQQQVRQRDQLFERTIRIGESKTVRLQFANERLLSYVVPAVEHILTDDTGREDLTICVWDSGDGSGKPPCPTWQTHRNYQWIDLLSSDHIKVACELSPARMTAIDFEKKSALFWINDASQFPWFEQSRPFRIILQWWGAAQNLHLLHAAAIGTTDDGGVLLAGKSGAGKSTTALTCLNNGMLYASDDHCLVGFDRSDPVVYGLYNVANLHVIETISRFPELERCIVNRDKLHVEKAMMFLFPYYPERIAKKLPLKAVLVPVVTGSPDTSIMATDWREAAGALIPSTMTVFQGSDVNDFYGMLRIIRSLPCFRINLGTETEQIPKAIKELLSSLPARQDHSQSFATSSPPVQPALASLG